MLVAGSYPVFGAPVFCLQRALRELDARVEKDQNSNFSEDIKSALEQIGSSPEAFEKAMEMLTKYKTGALDRQTLVDGLRGLGPDMGRQLFRSHRPHSYTLDDLVLRSSLSGGEPDLRDFFEVAVIEGKDSRQLSKKPDAHLSRREVFWNVSAMPTGGGSFERGSIDVLAPRISVIKIKGSPEVIEAYVPDTDRKIWIPVLYEKLEARWIRVNRTRLGDDLNQCHACHGLGRNLGPIPFKGRPYQPAPGWFPHGFKGIWSPPMKGFEDSITRDPKWDGSDY
jgi:hypothetical protein